MYRKRIRLGISSMKNDRDVQSIRSTVSSDSSHFIEGGTLTDLSESDLDEMFSNNSKVLQDFNDNEELPSSISMPSSRSFQSTLHIYINRPKDQNQTSIDETRRCNIINDARKCNGSQRPALPKIYSSYETLYDNYILAMTDRGWESESLNQSTIEGPKCSIDDYLMFGSSLSLTSDATIKSLSSDDSSWVSSIDPDDCKVNMTKSQDFQPCFNNLNQSSQCRRIVSKASDVFTRPMSYHMGDTMGYYTTSKQPTFPVHDTKGTRKEGMYTSSNIIICRSVKNNKPSPQKISKPESLIHLKSNSFNSPLILLNNGETGRHERMSTLQSPREYKSGAPSDVSANPPKQ